MKKKKGFTLIELLVTIVIIGVLALITVPIVSTLISSSRKQAFKQSVLSIVRTYEYKEIEESTNLGKLDVTTLDLNLKNYEGNLNRIDDSSVMIMKVTNGYYCADGTSVYFEIYEGDCSNVDYTPPEIKNFTVTTTTNSLQAFVTFSEVDTDIKEYEFKLLDKNDKIIYDWQRGDTLSGEEDKVTTKTYNGLIQNETYKVYVRIINTSISGNNQITDYREVKLKSIKTPIITYNTSKYELFKEVTIKFDNNPDIENSYKIVDSQNKVVNDWVIVSDEVSLLIDKYDYTILAKSTDLVNTLSSSSQIGYIDYTNPTILVDNLNTKWDTKDVVKISVFDNLSGVDYWCITNQNNSSSCEWIQITNTRQNSFEHTISSNGTYYAFAKDNVGNISESYEFIIDKVDNQKPNVPIITSNDSILSGNWHNKDFVLTFSGSTSISNITYYYGTTSNDISTKGSSYEVNNNTKETTYYVKACNEASICSDIAFYVAKLDKNQPNITIVKNVVNNSNELRATVEPNTSISDYNYQWYKDDKIIEGATNLTYTTSEAGTYKIKVTTGAGLLAISNQINILEYKITYNLNGGIGNIKDTIKVEDLNTIITNEKPERSGYEFLGWGISSSDKTKDYDSGVLYKNNESKNLYAIWKRTIKATFDANGAILKGDKELTCDLYNADTSCSVNSPTIEREGYIIVGFDQVKNSSTATYSSGGTVYISDNTTFYAITKELILNLSSTSGILYTNGNSKTVNITGINYGSLTCSVDTTYATCKISGNSLIITPKSKVGKVEITVKESTLNKTVSYNADIQSGTYSATVEYACTSGILSGTNCILTTPNESYLYCSTGDTLSGSNCYYSYRISATLGYNYYCPSGYTESGSGSSMTCYKNETATRLSNTTYYCPSGYTESGSGSSMTCYKTETTSRLSNTTYYCPSGYTESGSGYNMTCYKTVPLTTLSNTTYYCATGYDRIEDGAGNVTCSKTDPLTPTSTTTYSCPSGYTKSGSGSSTKCTKTVEVSSVATTTYSCSTGYKCNNWDKSDSHKHCVVNHGAPSACPSGYVNNGSNCIESSVYECNTPYAPADCIASKKTKPFICAQGTLFQGNEYSEDNYLIGNCFSYYSPDSKTTYSCPSDATSSTGSGSSLKCYKEVETTPTSKTTYSCPSGTTSSTGSGTSLKCYKTTYGSKLSSTTYSCPSNATSSTGSGSSLKCYKTETTSNLSNTTYYCPSGYTESGSGSSMTCYKTETTTRLSNTTYYCPSGYTESGSGSSMTCYKTVYTQNQSSSYYYCPSGTLYSNECEITSSYSAYTGYKCPSGYTASGSGVNMTCSKTVSATINYICPYGGTLSNTTCIRK